MNSAKLAPIAGQRADVATMLLTVGFQPCPECGDHAAAVPAKRCGTQRTARWPRPT